MKVKLSLRLVYLALLAIFVIVFVVSAEMSYHTPYSGRAYVERGVAPVFSRVSGTIEEIYHHNGDIVHKGEPLFRLDNRNYRAEIERLQASYETTGNKLKSLDCQLNEEEENRRKQEMKLEKYRTDLERDRKLLGKQAVAAKSFEDTQLQYDVALRELAALRQHIESLRRERGATGTENSELKQLRAELEIAQNNIQDTIIRAQVDGLLSYHQLYCGQMVMTSEKYAVIHELGPLTVNADLMEKSVGKLKSGQEALVTFDAIPGQVFHARMRGMVRELRSGYVAPNELHQIEDDSRWIRAVGRNRIQIEIDEKVPQNLMLISGSKAAVTLCDPSHPILNFLARTWIVAVSWSNFIY